jgi:spore coat polysaccharide biosynthesis protein SpsF
VQSLRVVAIIQARMGSTRLPGKVLKDLGGKTVLARVVERARLATLPNDVVVATSVQPADDAIAHECDRLNVPCFCGDEADVLDRYYQAAKKFSAEAIVRITADCPLIDPTLIDAAVHAFLEQKPDYVTNALVPTYPLGLDVEVFTSAALDAAWRAAKESYQRTHVTAYIYEHPELFRIASLTAEADYSKYRWTLDTPADLELIRAIYAHFGERHFGWREVLSLMEGRPELVAINAQVRQKTVREG